MAHKFSNRCVVKLKYLLADPFSGSVLCEGVSYGNPEMRLVRRHLVLRSGFGLYAPDLFVFLTPGHGALNPSSVAMFAETACCHVVAKWQGFWRPRSFRKPFSSGKRWVLSGVLLENNRIGFAPLRSTRDRWNSRATGAARTLTAATILSTQK